MISHFFGWDRTPFTKEIPTESLYQSGSFQQCVARLQYMVKTRSFGLVTGEIGAGKSTAIRSLRDGLDLTKYQFIYLCDSSLKPRDFYRELLHHLGIPPKFLRSETKRQFEHAIWDLYESQQKTVVVIIDEAHLLQGDMLQEIRFLTNFQIDSVSPLALVMVGQPELRSTLQMRLFKPITQRMNVRYHLGGLDRRKHENILNINLKQQVLSIPFLQRKPLIRFTDILEEFHARSTMYVQLAYLMPLFEKKS